eukprot:SAG31_NODE_3585_length_4096_cov_14.959470_2_plen_278_part_00
MPRLLAANRMLSKCCVQGFRPDLVPASVLNALTNYVPRLRDLLRSVDRHRTGKVNLHELRRAVRSFARLTGSPSFNTHDGNARLQIRRLEVHGLSENDIDTFMFSLDTADTDTFLYDPMLRWLSKRNKRLTDPGLLNVLKRLAGPAVYGRLHQVLLTRLERGSGAHGRLGDRDEITLDQFRDVCARLDVALSGRELELIRSNFGARNCIRIHQLLGGISEMMRKDAHLRKRWASGVLRRISQMIRQSGLTVRDSYYAYGVDPCACFPFVSKLCITVC